MPAACAAASPIGNLYRDLEQRAYGEGSAIQRRAERLALEQFGHDVGLAVQLAYIVDREYVRMIQATRGAGFDFEPPAAVGRLQIVGAQDLDRNGRAPDANLARDRPPPFRPAPSGATIS